MTSPPFALKRRLLLPVMVLVVLFTAVFVLAAFYSLKQEQAALEAALYRVLESDRQARNREAALEKATLQKRLQRVSETIPQQLPADLDEDLRAKLLPIKAEAVAALTEARQSAYQNLSRFIARLSLQAVWERDLPRLAEFVRIIRQHPQVLWVAFRDADGRYLTRYPIVDHHQLNPLQVQQDNRQNFSVLLAATDAAPDLQVVEHVIEQPIKPTTGPQALSPEAHPVGTLVLGIQRDDVTRLSGQFDQQLDRLVQLSLSAAKTTLTPEAVRSLQQLTEDLDHRAASSAAVRPLVQRFSAQLDASGQVLMMQLAGILVLFCTVLLFLLGRAHFRIRRLTGLVEAGFSEPGLSEPGFRDTQQSHAQDSFSQQPELTGQDEASWLAARYRFDIQQLESRLLQLEQTRKAVSDVLAPFSRDAVGRSMASAIARADSGVSRMSESRGASLDPSLQQLINSCKGDATLNNLLATLTRQPASSRLSVTASVAAGDDIAALREQLQGYQRTAHSAQRQLDQFYKALQRQAESLQRDLLQQRQAQDDSEQKRQQQAEILKQQTEAIAEAVRRVSRPQ